MSHGVARRREWPGGLPCVMAQLRGVVGGPAWRSSQTTPLRTAACAASVGRARAHAATGLCPIAGYSKLPSYQPLSLME